MPTVVFVNFVFVLIDINSENCFALFSLVGSIGECIESYS